MIFIVPKVVRSALPLVPLMPCPANRAVPLWSEILFLVAPSPVVIRISAYFAGFCSCHLCHVTTSLWVLLERKSLSFSATLAVLPTLVNGFINTSCCHLDVIYIYGCRGILEVLRDILDIAYIVHLISVTVTAAPLPLLQRDIYPSSSLTSTL